MADLETKEVEAMKEIPLVTIGDKIYVTLETDDGPRLAEKTAKGAAKQTNDRANRSSDVEGLH